MTTTVRVLLGAAAFALIVTAVYWFVSYEYAGTLLLGTMALGLGFAATVLAVVARRAALPGDRPDLRPEEIAGGKLEVPSGSTWPVVLALGFALSLAGLVYGWWLFLPGAVLVTGALLGLMRDTRLA